MQRARQERAQLLAQNKRLQSSKIAPSDTLMTPTRWICVAGTARRNADCSLKECRQADV